MRVGAYRAATLHAEISIAEHVCRRLLTVRNLRLDKLSQLDQ